MRTFEEVSEVLFTCRLTVGGIAKEGGGLGRLAMARLNYPRDVRLLECQTLCIVENVAQVCNYIFVTLDPLPIA